MSEPQDDALFDIDGLRPAEPDLDEAATTGERLRRRQAGRIVAGFHPLAYLVPGLRLHPGAPRVVEDDGGGRRRDPLRCGSCAHRVVIGGAKAGSFPKCLAGTRRVPVPGRVRQDGEPYEYVIRPRATGALASDVRAWWPACVDYQPVKETTPDA